MHSFICTNEPVACLNIQSLGTRTMHVFPSGYKTTRLENVLAEACPERQSESNGLNSLLHAEGNGQRIMPIIHSFEW